MRALAVSLALAVSIAASVAATDWSRFRGPNGSGISDVTNVPTAFGPTSNLVWKLPLPPGHSSPIVRGDRIYLTAYRGDDLVTFAIDRIKGQILWEKSAPKVVTRVVDKRNNPASPSPAVEDDGVYVFFQDYGLIAYETSGAERWRMPLGPFNNIYGLGASPIVHDNLVLLSIDQSTGSYLLAVNKRTGREAWRTPRPEARSGHATPVIWRNPQGKDEILLPGSFLMTSYDAATGAKLWWVRGLSFEIKSTPVISTSGDTLFINGYGSTENEPGQKINAPPAAEVWTAQDANKDGKLSPAELPDQRSKGWFPAIDLNQDGGLSQDEWEYYRAALDSENGLLAIRLGGKGDMTATAVKWKYRRAVPQLPSPLLFRDVLYMVNEGGIVTSINPETGELIKQGRLQGALGSYYSSPVAADGHLFFTSEPGVVAVLQPGGDLTPMAVNPLGEECYATPAFAPGRIYVRTVKALYAFGS